MAKSNGQQHGPSTADINTLCCEFCKGVYQDPKMLSCLHSFCLKCMSLVLVEGATSILCPTCGHPTPLGDRGVEGLQSNLRLNRKDQCKKLIARMSSVPPYCNSCESNVPQALCLECDDFLCAACWTAHQQLKKSRSHFSFTVEEAQSMNQEELVKLLPTSYTSPPVMCSMHEDQKVDLYCQHCSITLCLKCSVVDHKGHQVHEIKKYVAQCKRTLDEALERTTQARDTLYELSTTVSITLKRISERREQLDSNIKESFAKLMQLLKEREKLLRSKVADVAVAKEVSLSAQLEGIQHLLQPVTECCSIGLTACTEYNDFELIAVAKTIENRALNLQQQFADTSLELCESSNIPSEINIDSLFTMIKEFGRVSNTSPSNSTAIIPFHSLAIGAEMLVTVVSRDNRKQPVDDSGSAVSGRLICPNKEKKDCQVTDNGDGTYSIKVCPTVSGIHQLSITIHSQEIGGSPFNITAVQKRDYAKIMKPLKTITGIEYPRCIAFTANGDMFVTSNNHCVYIYDTNGKKKNTIGSQGGGKLQFENPHGIAIHGNEVYVAEYGGDRIHKFTTDGKFLDMFGDYGDEVGKFNNPHDVKVSPDGKVFVADTDNCRIQIFNPDWTISHVIDGRSMDNGGFKGPMGLAFDLLGNILITEHECHSITALTPSGKFVEKWTQSNLAYPVGIAVDTAGHVLVVNYNPGSLSILDSDGKFVHSLRGFDYPYGVAISSDGCLWIADYYNKRLVKY